MGKNDPGRSFWQIGNQNSVRPTPDEQSAQEKLGIEYKELTKFIPFFALTYASQWFLSIIYSSLDLFGRSTPPLLLQLLSLGISYAGGVFTLLLFLKVLNDSEAAEKEDETKNELNAETEIKFNSNYLYHDSREFEYAYDESSGIVR